MAKAVIAYDKDLPEIPALAQEKGADDDLHP